MSRCSLVWGLVVVGLAACSDVDKSAPTAPNFRPSPPPGTACNFKTLSSLAGSEFTTPEQQTAAGLIKQMQDPTIGPNGPGYDLLRLLGVTVDAGRQAASPAAGSSLANNVIFCLTTDIKQPLLSKLPINFGPSLDPTVDGAFAVRGGTSDPTGPIITRLGGSGLGVPSTTSSYQLAFGANSVNSGRTLIYAQPNTATFPGLIVIAGKIAVFDWNTVPLRSTLARRDLVVGVCPETGKSLLQEDNGIVLFESVAFLEASGKFCPTITLGNQGRWWQNPFALARRVFAPTPAFAAVVNPGGTGGRAGGFSTFYAVDGGNFVLFFAQQPTDNFTNTNISVTVNATASVNSAPIEGVGISLAVTGNSGSFNVNPPVPKAVTDPAGNATITFQIDKAGGYTIKATTDSIVNTGGTTHSYPPASKLSNLFNLQQSH
jgi:hypothetical protein